MRFLELCETYILQLNEDYSSSGNQYPYLCRIMLVRKEIVMNQICCANEFCAFWNKGKCIRDKISLDVQGCCRECFYVYLPEEELKKAREKILKM